MAERRMFHKSLLLGDLFTKLHPNAKLLYLYINMHADDDGICGNPLAICRMCGFSKKYLQELIDGGWLMAFEQEVVAVTHWHIHNQIRKDRYRPSLHKHVTDRLQKGADGVYQLATKRQPFGNHLATQDRIGKDSSGEDRSGEDRSGQERIEKAIFIRSSGPQAAGDDAEIDFDKILMDYQRLCIDMVPCTELTPPMREKIREIFRQGYNQYTFVNLFSQAMASDFLRGENPQNWRASLDWLLEPPHTQDVLAGKYANWRSAPARDILSL